EEARCGTALKQAFAMSEQFAEKHQAAGTIPGSEAFRLYDTYGLALDFTEELAKERGLAVDHAGFDRELEAQQERARQASKMDAVKSDPVYMSLLKQGKTDFLGYEHFAVENALVLAVLKDGTLVPRLDASERGEIVL